MHSHKRTIGYLGLPGSWSHLAAKDYASTKGTKIPEIRLVGLEVEALFEAFAQGQLDQVCVPYYSSIAGPTPYYSMMLALEPLWIAQEIVKPVIHSLATLSKDVTLADLRVLTGHPVALEEVRSWLLKNLPGVPWNLALSGSGAAQEVAKRGQPSHAAVTPPQAVVEHGLYSLIGDIPPEADNVTRWWILSSSQHKSVPKIDVHCSAWCWVEIEAASRDVLCQIQTACLRLVPQASVWVYQHSPTNPNAFSLVTCLAQAQLDACVQLVQSYQANLRQIGGMPQGPQTWVSSHTASNGACA
ncbi:prephenate dehydratase domain-containing protein [Orrella sp. 11846]|uniref:prephenate dehydratase domain-containing protein n=1 Tax=Orrella sp. 11846 TaxID=3409913 RepID=UPI003B5BE814